MNRGLPGWLLLFTVVIIGGFAGTALSAENASVTAPAEEAGSVHHEVTGDFSYTAPARLRFDGTRYGDLDSQQYHVGYGIGLRSSPEWEWRTGVDFHALYLGVPADAPLPEHLYGVGVPLGFNWKFADRWQLRVQARPGIYSDFEDITLDDVFVPIMLGASYDMTTNLNLLGGLSIEYRRDIPVFPYFGARWKFADQWTLVLIFPRPSIEYQLNNQLTLFAGGGLRGMAAQVNEHFGTDYGRRDLNNTTLTYWEVRAGGGLRYQLAKKFTFEVDGGWAIERRMVYRDPDETLKTAGAPYVQCSVTARF
ncbi:MAG TPA: DUF6268 family outer membrane beta-barrel protein [Verrucomicrobiae bacterium]